MPNIYHIALDKSNGMLRTIASDGTDHTLKKVVDEVYATDVKGNVSVHFSICFPDVMGVLNGEIELYALKCGPLWVVQDTANKKIRYLIPQAKIPDNNSFTLRAKMY